MRVMVLVKATEDSEKGILPTPELLAAMGKFNEELTKAGIMKTGDGLKPSSKGKRVQFSGQNRRVIDGPFAETKEQLLGFYVLDVADLNEALDIARQLSDANPTSTYEIRPIALYLPEARANASTEVVKAY